MFDEQDENYRHSVLPPEVTVRIAVEAGLTVGWRRYVGDYGKVIGIDRYGESAPWSAAFAYFGFTVDHLVEVLEEMLATAQDARGSSAP